MVIRKLKISLQPNFMLITYFINSLYQRAHPDAG